MSGARHAPARRSSAREALQRARALCKARGLRLTARREEVLELVWRTARPVTAYEIMDGMRRTARNPAPPTVYRALDFLVECGLIHKLETLHAFIGCEHPEHAHSGQFFICADCGCVDELESSAVASSLRRVEQRSGFRARRRVVELVGTCARCDGEVE